MTPHACFPQVGRSSTCPESSLVLFPLVSFPPSLFNLHRRPYPSAIVIFVSIILDCAVLCCPVHAPPDIALLFCHFAHQSVAFFFFFNRKHEGRPSHLFLVSAQSAHVHTRNFRAQKTWGCRGADVSFLSVVSATGRLLLSTSCAGPDTEVPYTGMYACARPAAPIRPAVNPRPRGGWSPRTVAASEEQKGEDTRKGGKRRGEEKEEMEISKDQREGSQSSDLGCHLGHLGGFSSRWHNAQHFHFFIFPPFPWWFSCAPFPSDSSLCQLVTRHASRRPGEKKELTEKREVSLLSRIWSPTVPPRATVSQRQALHSQSTFRSIVYPSRADLTFVSPPSCPLFILSRHAHATIRPVPSPLAARFALSLASSIFPRFFLFFELLISALPELQIEEPLPFCSISCLRHDPSLLPAANSVRACLKE